MHKIFVYGSLLPGLQNNFLLETAVQQGRGTVVGILFSMGSFPALISNSFLKEPTSDTVKGIVYEVDDMTLAQLDALEGYNQPGRKNLYVRELVTVTLENGQEDKAFIYSGADRIVQIIIQDKLSHVPGGDWMAWAEQYIIPHLDADLSW